MLAIERIQDAVKGLQELALGGTAVARASIPIRNLLRKQSKSSSQRLPPLSRDGESLEAQAARMLDLCQRSAQDFGGEFDQNS